MKPGTCVILKENMSTRNLRRVVPAGAWGIVIAWDVVSGMGQVVFDVDKRTEEILVLREEVEPCVTT